ncbi:MAG: hypothetical protein IJX88_06335 [Clostridia bacterium]|nr:hypothetical protein [Clostridia bacterium]
MLGYEKQPLVCKEQRGYKAVELSVLQDESINCEVADGVVQVGMGVSRVVVEGNNLSVGEYVPVPDSVFMFWQKTDTGAYTSQLGYVSKEGVMYMYETSKGAFVSRHMFGERVKPLTAMDREKTPHLLFVGTKSVYAYTAAGVVKPTIEKADGETFAGAGCVCKNRVFLVVQPFTLIYSAPLAPRDFTVTADDGGRICFPSDKGKMVAVCPFGEGLALFYEYGIAKLKIEGSARNFAWTYTPYGGGKIFGDSVGVCGVGGEKVFFLAEDGLYVLDKSGARKVCRELPIFPKTNGQVCNHAESNGKYYLTYKDDDGNACGVAVDAERESGYRTFAPTGLSLCEGKAFCMTADKALCTIGGGALPNGVFADFTLIPTDFGLQGRKTVQKLCVYGEGTATLKVSDGIRVKTFTIDFANGAAEATVRLCGERFFLSGTLQGNARIKGIRAEVSSLRSVSTKCERGRRTYGD